MVDEAQRQEIGAPAPVAELVPELSDTELMASCDLRNTCRREIDALVRLYNKRYEKHRNDFLQNRRGNKPLSNNEIKKFHRHWREYVRGIVEPVFQRARRAARMQAFVREQEEALGCKLVSSAEAAEIVPVLDLKLLAHKGRLRRVKFEKAELFYAEEDLRRIAVTDADSIEKKRRVQEANARRKAYKREEDEMKNMLGRVLYDNGLERHVIERLIEEALSFRSVQDLCETDYFSNAWNLKLPKDCAAYLEKEVLAIQRAAGKIVDLPQRSNSPTDDTPSG